MLIVFIVIITFLDQQASPTTSTSSSSSNTGKVELKSFHEYKTSKGKEWKSRVSTKLKKDKTEEVAIQIGLLEWNERELKPKRGKQMALRVSLRDPYATIHKKAIEKWKNYHSNLYDEEKEYLLTYEYGNETLFLPGTHSCFDLKSYKEEMGKNIEELCFSCVPKNIKLLVKIVRHLKIPKQHLT